MQTRDESSLLKFLHDISLQKANVMNIVIKEKMHSLIRLKMALIIVTRNLIRSRIEMSLIALIVCYPLLCGLEGFALDSPTIAIV